MKRSYLSLRFSIIIIQLFGIILSSNSQNATYYNNTNFLKTLYKDSSYTNLKKKVTAEFAHAQPGHWGEFIKGVDEDFLTLKNILHSLSTLVEVLNAMVMMLN